MEGRIKNEILGVKWLNHHQYYQCVIIVGHYKCFVILFAVFSVWYFFVLMWKSYKLLWNAIILVFI